MALRQMEDAKMARKRHTAEEIVSKLRQVDVPTAQGRAVAEAVRAIGVTEVTYSRWRSEYGGLRGGQGVEDDAVRGAARVQPVDPGTRQVRERGEIGLGGQPLGLESPHLTA